MLNEMLTPLDLIKLRGTGLSSLGQTSIVV